MRSSCRRRFAPLPRALAAADGAGHGDPVAVESRRRPRHSATRGRSGRTALGAGNGHQRGRRHGGRERAPPPAALVRGEHVQVLLQPSPVDSTTFSGSGRRKRCSASPRSAVLGFAARVRRLGELARDLVGAPRCVSGPQCANLCSTASRPRPAVRDMSGSSHQSLPRPAFTVPRSACQRSGTNLRCAGNLSGRPDHSPSSGQMQRLKESTDMPLVTPRQWWRVAPAPAVSAAALATAAGRSSRPSRGDEK
jgi:hypothetical protein